MIKPTESSKPPIQSSSFRSRDWLSANQGPVFPRLHLYYFLAHVVDVASEIVLFFSSHVLNLIGDWEIRGCKTSWSHTNVSITKFSRYKLEKECGPILSYSNHSTIHHHVLTLKVGREMRVLSFILNIFCSLSPTFSTT